MTEPARDQWAEWLLSRRHGGDPKMYDSFVKGMQPLRDRVLEKARVSEGDIVLDVGTGDGLIAFGAIEQIGKQGQVIFSDISQYLLNFCRSVAQQKGMIERCQFLQASADDLSALEDGSVDVVTVRSVLIYMTTKQKVFEEIYRILKPGGRLSLFEPINRVHYDRSPHLFRGYDVTPVREIAQKVRAVYQQPPSDPMLNFDERDLFAWAEQTGFREVHLEYETHLFPLSAYPMPEEARWQQLFKMAWTPQTPTLEEAVEQSLTPGEAQEFIACLRPLVESGQGVGRGAQTYLWAIKR